MWYQKDWFTGIDYYNLKEKQVHITEMEIKKPVEQRFHEQTEIYYVISGDAELWINGEKFQIQEGSFFCLYMHLFYRIENIRKPLRCVKVSFHIGLFMSLCFEQRKARENEMLVYGVQSLLFLEKEEQKRVERVLEDLLAEEKEQRFSVQNMSIYLAMQLYVLYCRYAMERKKKEGIQKDEVWNIIQRVLLDTSKTVSLEEYAETVGMTAVTLNRKIVNRCGYTFFQLQKMGKVLNACALLHFPDLNIQYISDYLGFTNVEDFYRVFKRYRKVSVREYQTKNIGCGAQMQSGEESLQILEYLFLHFQKPFQMKEMETKMKKKESLIERRYDGFCDVANRPHITCMRNPVIGHEAEYDLNKAEASKKVWVIGGGVAGMEAAKILHERGHEVTLFEATNQLGGEFLLAGEAPGKAEMKSAAMEMAAQVEKLVTVHKNTKVDAQMLEQADVDAVILAIGSSPITINLEGMDKLRHEVCPKGKVAVIGGGLVGLETADTLATDGCEVTVLEMKDSIGSDLGSLRKIAVMMKMQQLQVKLLPNSKVCKFTEEGVVLEDGTQVPCECAVFAVGFLANDSHPLAEVCEKRKLPYYVIGDAKSARRALDAIAEGFEVARTL